MFGPQKHGSSHCTRCLLQQLRGLSLLRRSQRALWALRDLRARWWVPGAPTGSNGWVPGGSNMV